MQAEVLTGMPVNSESDYQNAILKLIDHGCHRVVITLGSKGAICASADDRTPFFVNAKEAKAIDTTVRVLTVLVPISLVFKGFFVFSH